LEVIKKARRIKLPESCTPIKDTKNDLDGIARDEISCVWLSGTRILNSPLFPTPSPPPPHSLSLVFSHSVIRLSQLAPRRRYRPTYYPPLRVYSTTPPLFSFSAPSRCANALELPSILPMLLRSPPPSAMRLLLRYYHSIHNNTKRARDSAPAYGFNSRGKPRSAQLRFSGRAEVVALFHILCACENFISFNSLIKIPYTKSLLGIAI